jgi:dimethylargininase
MFSHALVRPPAPNFAEGLTTVDLGIPDYALALTQHARYCAALEACGLHLTCLPIDPQHPDSTFVEDTAVLTARGAILTRPGAPSRAGEVANIRPALAAAFRQLDTIEPPGTLDGGDICEAGNHFFIGVSARTDEEGARQLAAILARQGYSASCIDIRRLPGILHLKSGIAWLGDRRIVAIDALAALPELAGWEIIRVDPAEAYAANCVRVNDTILMASGFPHLRATLEGLGYNLLELDMSEFQKMDGGLSCLSLRF